jgi:hypothetical protein
MPVDTKGKPSIIYKGYIYRSKTFPSAAKKKISNRADRTGKRFGRLLAMEDLGIVNIGYHLWGCVCDCGTRIAVRSRELDRGHTKSCGCLWLENLRKSAGRNKMSPGQAAINNLLSNYIKSAKERGHTWNITKEQFKEITSSNCRYCGKPPLQIAYGNGQRNVNGDYLYNGIDRIDNSIGYEAGNIAPSCFICNSSKGTMAESDFAAHICNIYNVYAYNAARSARF